MEDGTYAVRIPMRWFTTITLSTVLTVCLLASSLALAEDAPDDGRVWLTRATVVSASGLNGTLTGQEVDELDTLGGALLVSGQAHALCTVAIQVGDEVHTATFTTQPQVRYVPLDNVGGGPIGWSLEGRGCRVDVEGAMLFVGDAAAYVGESPEITWEDVRGATVSGVR